MNLKIAELRKLKNVSQQELAEYLGVTFQSVSKWETKTTLPDITLLPAIARYFAVSVDEVLGLKPIRALAYQARNSDNRENWIKQEKKMRNRTFFWNKEFLHYLICDVWRIMTPIDVLELQCMNGELGKLLMSLLPKGSTYTGVDHPHFVAEAKNAFSQEDFQYTFIEEDLYKLKVNKKYDLCICQATLRHKNHPKQILQLMQETASEGGLIVCVEVNREFENVGFYIEGIDYQTLCTSFDWHKLWQKELELEGRDYAIGMRVPFIMQEMGLQSIDVRMNDKVSFVTPGCENYSLLCADFAAFSGYEKEISKEDLEKSIEFFMTRGYTRSEVEGYWKTHGEIVRHLKENEGQAAFLQVFGLVVTSGRK